MSAYLAAILLYKKNENIREFYKQNSKKNTTNGFTTNGKVLTQKLLSQGYQKTKLVATLKKFYGRHHDLVSPYNVAVSRIVSDVFASDAP